MGLGCLDPDRWATAGWGSEAAVLGVGGLPSSSSGAWLGCQGTVAPDLRQSCPHPTLCRWLPEGGPH